MCLLIARGKLCVFCVGLAHPVFGVHLSGFSFGFQRVIVFCSSGGDRQNVLFSSRVFFLCGFVWLPQLFVWFSQLVVLASIGGR